MLRMARVLLAVALLLPLSGCWSRRELTDVSFVGILGIDWVEGEYQVALSINAPRRQSGEQAGAAGREVWTISEHAPSLDAALSRLDQTVQRQVTLAHVRSIIFGADMARQGIGLPMDFMLRSVEIRPTAWVGVTNGTALDLLGARPRQDVPTEGPLGSHDFATRRSSITTALRLTHVASTLQEEGVDLLLPLFRRGNEEAPNPEKAEDEGALREREDREFEVIYGGGGVFKGDKLVTWFTPHQVRGYLWAKGKAVHGAVSAQCPTPKPDQRVVYRLRKSVGEVKTWLENGRPKAEVSVEVIADVNELTCQETVMPHFDVSPLQAALEKEIRENVRNAIDGAHPYGADVFGFGQELHRRNPKQFKVVQQRWPELLKKMPVTILVDARVVRLGQLNRRYRPSPAQQIQAD